MMNIQYHSAEVIIFESTLYQTTSTLLISASTLLLVDPNWSPREVQFIHSYIREHFPGRRLYLFLTHADFDHILGVGAFPEARIIASEGLQHYPEKDRAIGDIRDFDARFYWSRSYPLYFPEVDIVVEDHRQVVQLDALELHCFFAPGHTREGLMGWAASHETLILGDYLSDLEFPFVYDHSQRYLHTLDEVEWMIQNYPIRIAVPGHGQAMIDDLGEMKRRLAKDRLYLSRLQRFGRGETSVVFDDLIQSYAFARGLGEEHERNLEKIKSEIGE